MGKYIDVHKTIEELDTEYGAHSSTFSSVLTFRCGDLPKWMSYHQIHLLPGYTLQDFMRPHDVLIKIKRYRRDYSKYILSIIDPESKMMFTWKGCVPSSKPSLKHIIIYLIENYKPGKPSKYSDGDIVSQLGDMIAEHGKEKILKVMKSSYATAALAEMKIDSGVFPPSDLSSFETQALLDEVLERYKKSLGKNWPDAILGKIEKEKERKIA